jgi:glycosyltransferase involved in cell wall biosynthesis
LGLGGAEKQLAYLVRALVAAGAEVRVYSLTRGEFYETVLARYGQQPSWIGPSGSPAVRLALLTRQMREFRPHVIQSTHAFTNLYAGIIGRLLGATSVGAVRSNVAHTRATNGRWTRLLIGATDGLFVNSGRARDELLAMKLAKPGSVQLVPNVIDLDAEAGSGSPAPDGEERQGSRCRAIFVGRLIPAKRLDRFLRGLAIGCRQDPVLDGLVVGEGPCRIEMERLADDLGLGRDRVKFLGSRSDVPELLRAASMLVLCSDHEGFPNVVVEAMAARLPVLTTPAGDSASIVEDGVTGYVVPFDETGAAIADRMLQLARSPELRVRLGTAGHQKVARQYSFDGLQGRVMTAYRQIAERRGHRKLLTALQALGYAA